MPHSRLFQEKVRYQAKFLCDNTPQEDRPLIAQLCGPDQYILLKTAKEISPFVDGIDLNCSCPQGIARRGLYGAYLSEEEDLLLSIVQKLVHHLPDTTGCILSLFKFFFPTLESLFNYIPMYDNFVFEKME